MPKHVKFKIKGTIDYTKVIEGWSEQEIEGLLNRDPIAIQNFEDCAMFLVYSKQTLHQEEEIGD